MHRLFAADDIDRHRALSIRHLATADGVLLASVSLAEPVVRSSKRMVGVPLVAHFLDQLRPVLPDVSGRVRIHFESERQNARSRQLRLKQSDALHRMGCIPRSSAPEKNLSSPITRGLMLAACHKSPPLQIHMPR